jgi:hypothetical protein
MRSWPSLFVALLVTSGVACGPSGLPPCPERTTVADCEAGTDDCVPQRAWLLVEDGAGDWNADCATNAFLECMYPDDDGALLPLTTWTAAPPFDPGRCWGAVDFDPLPPPGWAPCDPVVPSRNAHFDCF